MGSITSINPNKLEPKRVIIEIGNNKDGIVSCHFCSAIARQYAVKKDGARIPCCFDCVNPESYKELLPWVKKLEKISGFNHKRERWGRGEKI